MALSFRTRLLLAIGLPLLVVYAAMAWLLSTRLERGAIERLERVAAERVETFAARIDDRVRLQGEEGAVSAFAEFDRKAATTATRYLVLDRAGRVVHDSADRFPPGTDLAGSAEAAERPQVVRALREALAGGKGVSRVEGTLSGETGWLVHVPIASTGGALLAGASEATVLSDLHSQMRLGLAVLAAGLVAILGVVVVMAGRVTRPVARLAEAVDALGRGELDARVTGVTTGDEIGRLASAFNRMIGDLEGHVAARALVEGDLRAARRIQNALLPKRMPDVSGYAIAATNLAARHVAGDFYDAFEDRGELVFLVADVSGKGLPSALYMAVAKTVLQRSLVARPSIAEAVAAANDFLEREQIGTLYLTAWIGRLEPATGRLRWVNAAHPPPWIVGAGEPREFGGSTGGPVGMFPGRTYEERETRLAPGESIVIFSDGVPEARRADGEFYGEERLKAFLSRSASVDAAEVAAEVETFQEGALADDVTAMVLVRR